MTYDLHLVLATSWNIHKKARVCLERAFRRSVAWNYAGMDLQPVSDKEADSEKVTHLLSVIEQLKEQNTKNLTDWLLRSDKKDMLIWKLTHENKNLKERLLEIEGKNYELRTEIEKLRTDFNLHLSVEHIRQLMLALHNEQRVDMVSNKTETSSLENSP